MRVPLFLAAVLIALLAPSPARDDDHQEGHTHVALFDKVAKLAGNPLVQ